MSAEPIRPLAPGERALQLDVLRGFALLGIFLMNIEGMVGPLNDALTGLDPRLLGADRVVDAAIFLLVQGKFFTLFSLLFGAGFVMILQRAEARGGAGGWLYLRRLLVLLGIGLVHALAIWSGDILVMYALIGLVLLTLFRHTPTSRLPKWALVFYSVPVVFTGLMALLGLLMQADPQAAAAFQRGLDDGRIAMEEATEAQRLAYGSGSFAEASAQRLADLRMMFEWFIMFGPMVLGMFLIGAWFMRSGVLMQPERHLAFYRRLQRAGFLFGLPLVAGAFWLMPTFDFGRMDMTVALASAGQQYGSLLLCLAYLSTLVLALQAPHWRQRLAWLAPAGRMALSNYLLQSLIAVGVFYGYGLGYFEQLPRAWQPVFVAAVFVAQVQASHWWLARFRFGPAEWLWRSLTYLRPQPMRL